MYLSVLETGRKDEEAAVLVFLHGLGSCAQDWILQFGYFNADYRILAVDFPGHGDSPGIRHWPRAEFMAAEVRARIRTYTKKPFHLVGLSLGGMVALQIALDYPEDALSLTVVNACARMTFSWLMLRQMFSRVPRFLFSDMQSLGNWIAADLFPHTYQKRFRELAGQRIASVPRGTYARMAALVLRFNVGARLRTLDIPVMVIAGDRDRTVPVKAKKTLAAAIRGAEFHQLNDSGHATPVDQATTFNWLLGNFITRVNFQNKRMELAEINV